jgi:hypothetical protein
MNIWELEIGESGIGPDGTVYKVIGDSKKIAPTLGVVPVRIAKDQAGNFHNFIRGIEVERIPQESDR